MAKFLCRSALFLALVFAVQAGNDTDDVDLNNTEITIAPTDAPTPAQTGAPTSAPTAAPTVSDAAPVTPATHKDIKFHVSVDVGDKTLEDVKADTDLMGVFQKTGAKMAGTTADKVKVDVEAATRRLGEGRRLGTAIKVLFTVTVPNHLADNVVSSVATYNTPASITSLLTQGLADAGISAKYTLAATSAASTPEVVAAVPPTDAPTTAPTVAPTVASQPTAASTSAPTAATTQDVQESIGAFACGPYIVAFAMLMMSAAF